MSDRARRVEEIFQHALELSEDERARYLRDNCDDDAMLDEVESLLVHHSEEFLETPRHLREFDRGRLDAEHPLQIGPYKILNILGKGGMGIVYLAEQQSPVRRRVALKLVQRGLDTKQVVARFETERQALALMDHPNIARVFDAGHTEGGRPYFVMEYVKGEAIVDYCDRTRLTVAERLELFTAVCDGVHHAHQKGVIHRDIKSSNVLVTIQGDDFIPKIIDFGVAKAIDRQLTEHTLFTEFGQIIGTPEYMSPEQAEMTVQDIDTRTDVYSLGVLLYKLLVDAFPFEPGELRKGGYDEIRRMIREDEPPKPSTRLLSLGDASTGVSQKRRTNPSAFARELRGDLDWITMKALEKDRRRRYPSASELAADVRRHLRDEPVQAGPPSNLYRLGKFARRHRVGVAAAAAVMAALILGAAGTTIGWVRAARAEEAARSETAFSQQVTDFLVGLFREVDPDKSLGREVTAREVVDVGVAKIREETARFPPQVRWRLLEVMGTLYRDLDRKDLSESLLEDALETARAAFGKTDHEVAQTLNQLGTVAMVKGEFEVAEGYFQEALEIFELREGRDSLPVATCLKGLGDAATELGDLGRALAFHEEALRIREHRLEPGHELIGRSLRSLARVHEKSGNADKAAELFKRSLDLRMAALPAGHRDIGVAHSDLGHSLLDAGDLPGAREQFAEALRILEQVLGSEHEDVASAAFDLGDVLVQLGRFEDAADYFGRAQRAYEVSLGERHPVTAESMQARAHALRQLGQAVEADALERRAAEILGAGS